MMFLYHKIVALKKDEGGQIVVFTAIFGLILVMFVSLVYNVGVFVGEKMKVQDAADAAAYSQAVWEARTLNFYAYTNRARISYLVATGFLGGIQSQKNMWQVTWQATSWVPYLGQFTQAMYNFYNSLAITGPLRNVTYSLVQALYLEQFAAYVDMNAEIVSAGIMKDVVERIDASLNVNDNLSTAGAAAIGLNTANYNRIINPWVRNFKKLKNLYNNSRDGYTAGTSFPRFLSVSKDAIIVEIEFGIQGYNDLTNDSFVNRETVFGKAWVVGLGEKKMDVPLFPADTYKPPGTTPGYLRFFNYKMPGKEKEMYPSVYSVVTKPANTIPQISFGLFPNQALDINAVSRAQVFYWDPDRSRSVDLKYKYPSGHINWNAFKNYKLWREPNLFNPFWRARLARLDSDGRWVSWRAANREFLPIMWYTRH